MYNTSFCTKNENEKFLFSALQIEIINTRWLKLDLELMVGEP